MSVVSNINADSPVGVAFEEFTIANASATSVVITPTVIDAIYHWSFSPTNSAAATGATSIYGNGFVFGAATLTLAFPATNCTGILKIEGARS